MSICLGGVLLNTLNVNNALLKHNISEKKIYIIFYINYNDKYK